MILARLEAYELKDVIYIILNVALMIPVSIKMSLLLKQIEVNFIIP